MDVYNLEQMALLKETPFRTRMLLPLLRAMGYEQVTDWHGGSAEKGKDIICWNVDPIKGRRNIAVVVKATRINSNSDRGDVAAQVNQAFALQYMDKVTGESRQIHEVWVVTNQSIPVGGTDLLRGAINPVFSNNVVILDGPWIWDRVEMHFPIATHQRLNQALEPLRNSALPTMLTVGNVDNPIAVVTVGDRSLLIGAAHGESGDSLPMQLTTSFAFPDNPDGRKVAAALQNALQGKQRVVLTEEYIRGIEFAPEFKEQIEAFLGPMPNEWSTLEIGPSTLPSISIAIGIRSDDGEEEVLRNILLKREPRNDNKVVLSNQKQEGPITFTLEVDESNQKFNWSTKLREGAVSANQVARYFKFLSLVESGGTLTLYDENTDIVIASEKQSIAEQRVVNEWDLAWSSALSRAQQYAKVPILVPARELTKDEVDKIREIINAIASPEQIGTWSRGQTQIVADRAGAEETLQLVCSAPTFMIRTEHASQFDLFGSVFGLGRVQTDTTSVRFTNLDDFRLFVENVGDEEQAFTLEVEPGENASVTTRWLDLLEFEG